MDRWTFGLVDLYWDREQKDEDMVGKRVWLPVPVGTELFTPTRIPGNLDEPSP